ncbi:LamG-like jellyroll fold domain-containing protein [Chryseobacterium vrystaatense]|uniref:Por secretion system C-terminal sorting domain-containing protein n=1 Tax=Chryseobacterium vrystaatense TaxID=307480 RepID=A0A1M4U2H3_9FLAO|nr:LamG-like jellyroll fold domain-containing protein [Chryseobacterium vrystaatense]SHE50816.1 Por secretion system C-terminal sorting domain-containing protein [Chryseobacterium vrystaatense]
MKTKLLSMTVLLSCLLGAQAKKVLFIGIDGCRADVMMSSNIPNIQNLVNQSIYSLDGLCAATTWSGNGWSTMLTGVWHTKHNVQDNNFTNPNYINYPDFLTRAETYNPNLRTMSLVNWAPLNDKIVQTADVQSNLGSDLAVKNAAVTALQNDNPDILFVDFDDVDHAGHSYGFAGTVPQYVSSIQTTDTYIGEIVNAMKSRPTYNSEDWLVVLTTDHGAVQSSHGGGNLSERNIFNIYSNPGFTPQQVSKTVLESNKTFNQLSFPAGTYAKPANQTPFNFGATQDFTIEFWVKPNAAYSSDPVMISNKNWASGSNKGFVIAGSSGQNFKMNIGDGTNRIDLTGGKAETGKWKHIAVSFDRDGLVTLYEDGVPVTFAKMNTIGNIDSGLPLTINQDGTNVYGLNLAASYKDIRIWKSALPANVIVNWANQDITSSHPYYAQLLADWKCGETSGNTLTDSSPNANNLAVTGSPAYAAGTTNTFKIYDYTSTMRETDHFPTVLNWMCIPVQASWGIDGINRIPVCANGSLAVEDAKTVAHDFKLYPNPASESISIQYQSDDKEIKMEIIDAKGSLISVRNLKSYNGLFNETINVQSLPAGAYFIKINGSKKSLTKTFIKK